MTKISEEFSDRLLQLEHEQKIRAIIMLDTGRGPVVSTGRRSKGGRQDAIEAVRKAAEPALVDIDRILKEHGGKRLAAHVDALGAIAVETTADGTRALADCPMVKAILEDQPISLLQPPTRKA